MITLLTDFGSDSFQTVRSRTWLALNCPEEKVLDISHSIHANDINEAAYIFRLVLDQFQTDTVHILAIDFDQRAKNPEVIYFKYKGQHILTYNSGMASILLEQQTNEVVTVGNYTSNHYDSVISCFGEKAKQLLLGQLSDQKSLIPDQLNIKTVLNPVSSEKMLHGHVVYFDALGTCYTNISQNEFEAFVDGVAFDIVLSRHERISTISTALKSYEGGGTYCYFNTSGMLTISVYRGSAKGLYGLKRGQTIIVKKR